ncbi:hypothetical protein [Labrenzia sp. VG12]|uniref:argonaute/piwi family protein n=1 Tax=Labrenzia sp. VG12 TaxID=2021862 RepID=UPI000B8C6ADA|nr:hypothetical protein [Labrenzia sp. VG12]ASP34998.1 hypothetical protein CHH27_18575 [Labrenzia sp. VG12]
MAHYSINFAPLSVGGDTTALIGRQPYDDEHLRELRQEFSRTHVFRRDQDTIIDIPIRDDREPLGNLREEIDLAKDRLMLPSLFSSALLRLFSGQRQILSDRPVSVLGDASRGMIGHSALPSWIQKRTGLRFDTRPIYTKNRILGVVCEARSKNLVLGTCADLLSKGVSLEGRYVQIEVQPYDTRLMTRRRLIGKVREVRGDDLVLEDHAEGFETVAARDAFLEGRRETLNSCVRQILGRDAEQVLAQAEALEAEFHSGPKRKEQIERALDFLRKKDLEAVPGAKVTIGETLSSAAAGFPSTETIPKPFLVFDPSGSRKDDWAERGIKKNGPYDQRTFSPKQLNIAVICQAHYEGQVDRFVAKFLDGMPDAVSGNKIPRYGDGFLRRFQLERPNLEFFTARSSSTDDYQAASHRALSKASDEGFKWDLALVQVEEEFKSLDDGSNPYFATKSTFLKRDVPVQSVLLETMGQPNGKLVFSLNHLSLATYAKLGGTPWLLASPQTVAHELVIGLGSHSVSASRIGARKRFVGITTVFSSDGSYLLTDRTAVVPFEEYSDALYATLKRAITTVRKQDNWRSTDKVRLVFHVFKPLKDTEAEAVEQTVKDLNLDNVTFAFIHIAQSHPYLIFDNKQKGIGYRDPKKGVLGPSRGLHIKLGDRESLVVFSGASELKQASDGMPRPCLLKLHRLSTFKDMTYLARQAFEFAGHSWRMLAPEPFPITIRYSDLIAERLSGLSSVSGWDAEAVRFGQIGKTLWFL